jgi:toxin ParE1/3/4
MIVVISDAAEADLRAIGDWIAADSAERALGFLTELRQCCQTLASTPRRYPVVSRYASLKIRRRAYRDYLIFYRISKNAVEILHVLHGARDYESILDSDQGMIGSSK